MQKSLLMLVHIQCLCTLAANSTACSNSNNQCASTVRASVFPQAWSLVHLSPRISAGAGAEAAGGGGLSLRVTWCEKVGMEGIWCPLQRPGLYM